VPKLVVVVDKDDTGKLWNYVFTEEGLVRGHNSLEAPSHWVHKPYPSGDSSQGVSPTEPAEEDHITLGLLLPQEETTRVHTRIKKK